MRQVVLVVQATAQRHGGSPTVELLYFAINIAREAMSAKQLLRLVRLHWAIAVSGFWQCN